MKRKRFDPLAMKRKKEGLKHVGEKEAKETIKKVNKKEEPSSSSVATSPSKITEKTPITRSYDNVTKYQLLEVELPIETRSYKPVSHKMVIEETENALKSAGFDIIQGRFESADEGRVMSGHYYLQKEEDKHGDQYGHMVSVQNSYNKRVTLKFAYGIVEWDSEIGILSNEITFKRKHTGSVISEFKSVISSTVYMLTEGRSNLIEDIEMLQYTKIKEDLVHKLLGQLFFREVITSSQLNTLRRKFKQKKNTPFKCFPESSDKVLYRYATTWSIYSAIAKVLKESHAANQIDNFISTHEFISETFGLI